MNKDESTTLTNGIAFHRLHFNYASGAFATTKAEMARFVAWFFQAGMGLHPASAVLEGRPREYRVYFPLLREYWWPTRNADESGVINEYKRIQREFTAFKESLK